MKNKIKKMKNKFKKKCHKFNLQHKIYINKIKIIERMN